MTELLLGFQAASPTGGSGALIFLAQMAAIFAIFYFLLIRPQRKEQQRHQEMVKALGRGSDVVTTGGIIGTVVDAKDDRLTIESAGSRLVIERSKVARVTGGKGAGVGASEAAQAEPAPPASGARAGRKRG